MKNCISLFFDIVLSTLIYIPNDKQTSNIDKNWKYVLFTCDLIFVFQYSFCFYIVLLIVLLVYEKKTKKKKTSKKKTTFNRFCVV
jgi:hypothetical protein